MLLVLLVMLEFVAIILLKIRVGITFTLVAEFMFSVDGRDRFVNWSRQVFGFRYDEVLDEFCFVLLALLCGLRRLLFAFFFALFGGLCRAFGWSRRLALCAACFAVFLRLLGLFHKSVKKKTIIHHFSN